MSNRLYGIRKQYNTLKIPYDSRKHQASIVTNRITRREKLVNHETLMAVYTESMANWKADEQELNEKRSSLNTRLVQIQKQAAEDMAKARQAEPMQQPPTLKPWRGATPRAKRTPMLKRKGCEKPHDCNRAQSSPALDRCSAGTGNGHRRPAHS